MQSEEAEDFDLNDDFEVEEPQNELDALSVSVDDFDGLVLAPSDWTERVWRKTWWGCA